jgi:adenylate cyclase, class 2
LSAPLRNLEVKARDAHPRRSLGLALPLAAEDREQRDPEDREQRDPEDREQRDTYFARARGRLKLREQEPGGAELIAYERSDAREPSPSAFDLEPPRS